MFTVAANSIVAYSKLLAFAFLLVILEIILFLLLVLHANVPPLEERRPQIPCAKMMTHFINKRLCLSVSQSNFLFCQ